MGTGDAYAQDGGGIIAVLNSTTNAPREGPAERAAGAYQTSSVRNLCSFQLSVDGEMDGVQVAR
jgi:hypothetical protein